MADPPLQGRFRATSLSAAALRQNEAFAVNFLAAGAGCQGPAVAAPRRMSLQVPLREMTTAEVEQISGRLAEVKRSCHDFGEAPTAVEEVVAQKVVMKTRTSDASNGDVVDTCRAQRRVRKQFEEIDAGRLDPQSVFSKISGADQRVKLKLHYFRDRSDLVLPAIEDRFVTHDAKRDCLLLDLPLLQSQTPGSLSARTPRKATPRKFKEIEVSLSRPNLDEMESPEISPEISLEPSSSHQASRFDSQRTRPGRIETAEQKSLRLMRAARIRDERILVAQHNVKYAELEWRLNHFEMCRRKNARKKLATTQRIVLSWLTLAFVTKMWQEALLRDRWQRAARSHNFGDHYANRSKAHLQRAQKLVHKSMKESCRNMNDFRQVLQVRSTRSKAAWKRWDQIWLILKFISRLRVRIKFNRAADAIKQFIDSSWRGMHFRSKVGVYLANVRVLQRALRAAHRFRVNVKLCIYSPSLWELETQLLGEKLKAHLPKDYIKQKINQHRQAWDWDGRIRALQDLAKERRIKGLKGPGGEKRRQALAAKAKPGKPDRRRRGALRAGQNREGQVFFSELGEAISNSNPGTDPQTAASMERGQPRPGSLQT